MAEGGDWSTNPQAQKQMERFAELHKNDPEFLALIAELPFRPVKRSGRISKRNWYGQFAGWRKRLYDEATKRGISTVPLFIPEQFDDTEIGRSLVSALVCSHCLVAGSVTGACAGCKKAVYCNASCQRQDWADWHRITCHYYK